MSDGRSDDAYKQAALAWLRLALHESGLSAAQLAKMIGVAPSTLQRPLNNAEHPFALSGRTLAALAQALNRPLPPLLTNEPAAGEAASPAGRALRIVAAPELDLSERPETASPRASWPFARAALGRLGLNADGTFAVYPVTGQSMAPTLCDGDFGLIDCDDKRLGLGGVFALWNGDGVIFRRVGRALGGAGPEARLLVSADSRLVNDREFETQTLDPVGRVVTVIRRVARA